MDFIDFEAMETDQQNEDLIFSNDENKDSGKVDMNFIGDSELKESEPSFYRNFVDQRKDPRIAVYEEGDDETFVDTRDLHTELYAVKNSDNVIFDEFSGYGKCVHKFKKSLSSFDDSKTENFFFDAVIYGLLFKLTEGKSFTKDKVESILRREVYKDFCDVKDRLKLDALVYRFFDKCAQTNELLAKKTFFFKVL